MTNPEMAPQGSLRIAQIMLENVEFRHTGEFLASPPSQPIQQSPASVSMQVTMGEDQKTAAVRLRLVSEAAEAPYAYSVSYVVLFSFDVPMSDDLPKRLMVTGGNMAMPFIRELVANLSSRGRFGTTWVSPVNFNEVVQAKPEVGVITSATK